MVAADSDDGFFRRLFFFLGFESDCVSIIFGVPALTLGLSLELSSRVLVLVLVVLVVGDVLATPSPPTAFFFFRFRFGTPTVSVASKSSGARVAGSVIRGAARLVNLSLSPSIVTFFDDLCCLCFLVNFSF